MNGMRGLLAGTFLFAALSAMSAAASAPESSLRPSPRPAADAPAARAVPPAEVLAEGGVLRSPRPEARPEGRRGGLSLRVFGLRTQPDPDTTIGRRGALCGANDIEGVRLTAIAGRAQGCGVEEPVRVTAVGGIPLSQPATIDCPTALALRTWVNDALVPTVGRKGGGVARIDVFASYACRPRNNQKGARVSEHGRGRAIDIGGITLKNGTTMTVLRGWRDDSQGPILRQLHRAACGPFGTVLGPNSDRFHQNHFHFDTASYRSGPFCR
jgi:hypothetical protein